MTIETAKSLSSEEFEALYNRYEGCNTGTYKNCSSENDDDRFYEFLKSGCKNLEDIQLFREDL